MRKNDDSIRLERPEDYRVVETLVREAFWNVYRPGCLEHFVLHCLRNDPAFVPELNFVMEKDGQIIGQNVLSLNNSMNFIFSAQLGQHRLGDAVCDSSFRFNNAAMLTCNGSKLGHVIHSITSRYQLKDIIDNFVIKVNSEKKLLQRNQW